MKPLLEARRRVENLQDDIDTLLSAFFAKSTEAQSIIHGRDGQRKLYEYWEEAGLTDKTGMTYTEFFENYYNEHKREFKFEEFETYDYSKPVNSNSKVARNNEILNIIQHRLMDPDTLVARTTPGGFDTASLVGKEMRILDAGDTALLTNGLIDESKLQEKLDEDNDFLEKRRATDLNTWVAYSQQNQIAGKLIGVFANHSSNNIFARTAYKMEFADAPVTINGKSLTNLIPADTNTIQTLAELLAASVDAVKDPVLNYFNLNTYTASTAATLARLGYTLEEIGLFLNQPIIRELCSILANNSRETMDSASKKLKNMYSESMTAPQKAEIATDMNTMRSNIFYYGKAKRTSKKAIDAFFEKNGANQVAILDMFINAQTAVNELSGFISTTKFTASNAVGSTSGDIYESMYKAAKYVNKDPETSKLRVVVDPVRTQMSNLILDINFRDKELYLEQVLDNPFAFEQTMFTAIREAFLAMNSQHFPYETAFYKRNRDYLNLISRSQSINADTINKAHRAMYQYLLEHAEGSIFDPNTILPDGTTRKEYYLERFPADVRQILAEEEESAATEGRDLSRLGSFIKTYLDVYNNKGGNLIINAHGNMQMTVDQKNDLIAAWETLSEGTVKESAFAKDLFLYTYFKSGFKFGVESFSHLIPNSIKANVVIGSIGEYKEGKIVYREVTFSDFLRDIQQGTVMSNYNGTEFIKQFILDNLDEYAFVSHFYNTKDLQGQAGVSITNNSITFNLESFNSNSIAARKVMWGSKASPRYAPVIIYNSNVYMLAENAYSNPACFTENNGNLITYNKVGTLTSKEKLQLEESESNNIDQNDITFATAPSTRGSLRKTTQGLFELISSEFSDSASALQRLKEIAGSEIDRLLRESNQNPKPVLNKDGEQFEDIC